MSLTMFFTAIRFIAMLAPMVSQLYAVMAAAFPPGTPGAVKLESLKSMVLHAVQTVDELKQFEPMFEALWPHLKVLVDRYHAQVTNPVTAQAA